MSLRLLRCKFAVCTKHQIIKEHIIRLEQPQERHEVENLVREAFWNVYRQGYGKAILDHTPARAAELGFGAVCFDAMDAFFLKRPAVTSIDTLDMRRIQRALATPAAFPLGKRR